MTVIFVTMAILNIGASVHYTGEMNKANGWQSVGYFVGALLNASIAASIITVLIEQNG